LDLEQKEEEKGEGAVEPLETLNLGWYWSQSQNEWQMAGLAQEDRLAHLYIIGATGTGKSRFMEYLIQQDIGRHGFGVIDPHGDLVDSVKGWIAACEDVAMLRNQIVVIDPTSEEELVSFNPLERLPGISPAEQALELVAVFKKIWKEAWGARMEDLLKNSLVTLIENNLTLLELPLLLVRDGFRERLLEKTTHPIAREYFSEHFNKVALRTRHEWIESTLNKVDAFLFDDRIRLILSSPRSSFNFRDIMDGQKILLVKLAKAHLKDNADLLGALLLAKLQMAASTRADLPLEQRVPFFLYIDEFQHFATDTFVEILSEARKYGLALIMAHQNLDQLSEDLKGSILGNTSIQVYFRISRQDAEVLAKEAFKTTGLEVKYAQVAEGGYNFDFYSYPEEWERYFQALTDLPARTCYIKHKRQGGIIRIETPEVISLEELGKSQNEEVRQLGRPYLRKREELERAYRARLAKLLPASHSQAQEEAEEIESFWHPPKPDRK